MNSNQGGKVAGNVSAFPAGFKRKSVTNWEGGAGFPIY